MFIGNRGERLILGNLKKLVSNSDIIFELFLLVVMAAVCIVWTVEEKLAVIFEYDRYDYFITLIVLSACLSLSILAKKTHGSRVVILTY